MFNSDYLDLHYLIPETTMGHLHGNMEPGSTLDLSDSRAVIDQGQLLRFCGREAYVGVVIDSRQSVAETNEDNNVNVMSLTLTQCPGICCLI